MSTRKAVADMIFPDIHETIADLQKKYPPRPEKVISRFAPSPTGFLHVGAIRSSFLPWKFVKQNNGKFILRIEDTDQKRLVEGSIDQIIDLLKTFNISIDEWPLWNNNSDVWNYWPYIQSERMYMYQVFAKELISKWLAYPCWMKTEEIDKIREQQTKTKILTWIYGNYSAWRNKTPDEIIEKLASEGNKYEIIRFRSHGDTQAKIVFEDILRGKVNMADNYNDIVLLKWDWLPTYHLAHIVDDTLMRVTHVIRAEERLTSVPLHLQLFKAFDLPAPLYCHLSQLLKSENGKKRKLSKRKDPESDVAYFFQNGYAPQWVLEYILILIDSAYEERQRNNPDKSYLDFPVVLEDTNKAWALFDLVKLQSVNNTYLSRISTDELYNQSLARAKKHNPELTKILEYDPKYIKNALWIERLTEKDPKRFTTFFDVYNQLTFFVDEEREKTIAWIQIHEIFTPEVLNKFIPDYIKNLDLWQPLEAWFEKLKEIWKKHWFAWNNAEFKEWWYIGKIWDIAMLLRIVLCCSPKTPDLYSVMKVMWRERVVGRLKRVVK